MCIFRRRNLARGDILNQTRSSTAVTDPTLTILEDDNNGQDGGDATTNGITVLTAVSLDRRQEPTTVDYDINDNGRRDSSTNQTIDLGITLDQPMDFGDLPTIYDNTIFGEDGPRHPNTGLILGTDWDADNDGQESAATNGDDINNLDDEDGIDIPTGNGAGTWGDGTAEIDVTVAGGPGCVLGWTDFNLDGDFDDEINDGSGGADVPELMFVQFLPTGTTQVTPNTPQSTAGAGTFVYPATLNMRYRIFPANDPLFAARSVTLDANLCPDPAANSTALMSMLSVSAASGGEVEDYQQDFSPTAVSLQAMQANLASAPFVLILFVLVALALSGLGIVLIRRQRV
ncbi:MAG: hypothetical protein HC804_04870 [Anaerolineae bacterium]|nr:hypothetical protein [Anaerolineae bacterium]